MASIIPSTIRPILLSLLLLLTLGVGIAFATDISLCQALSSSGSYTLTRDVNSSMQCFTISANNIILDCAGHNITGLPGNMDRGIDNGMGHSNITVENCNITRFDTGIFFMGAHYGTIKNNTISSNGIGISLPSSSNNYIYNNLLNNSANYGNMMGSPNFWNTTLNCNGVTNIIGGDCIGGNAWAAPVGGDYSQGCTDVNPVPNGNLRHRIYYTGNLGYG
jgi:parallel beta-helix repeat protein